MLPYFIGVHSNNATLETKTAGTIAELAEAHQTLTAPPRSPEGVKDRKEIPFRFPAAVEVHTRYKLGLALTSQNSWSSPAVKRDRDLLLGVSHSKRIRYIERIRAALKETVKANLNLIKTAEREAFSRKSYYYYKQQGIQHIASNNHNAGRAMTQTIADIA